MQIKSYPQITTISDNDLFLVQTASDGAYKSITSANLKTYFRAASTKILTFVNDGDANGALYYLGTNSGFSAWSNPVTAGFISILMSSIFGGNTTTYGNVAALADRVAGSGIATANSASQWVQIRLNGKKLVCSYYFIRGRNLSSNEIKNWKLQASNDASTWADLDTVINTNLANSASFHKAIASQSIGYEYFRILSTGSDSGGANILAFDEIELYGVLQ